MVILPDNYKLKLLPETTEIAIKEIKSFFQGQLTDSLCLRRVTAPLLLLEGTGLNDENRSIARPVTFETPAIPGTKVEIVQSLAKWKRVKLAEYDIAPGYGIYTVMKSLRPDVPLDNFHSLYVDQWDWELAIHPEDRTLDYLKEIVGKVYEAVRATEQMIYRRFPHITPSLPEQIHFVHSEDLLAMYPGMSPKEREREITRRYGAVFVIGIGGKLADGVPHDRRAPDYDDWSTPVDTPEGIRQGLNGDILLWDNVLQAPMELSSMGIRVNAEAMRRQLDMAGCSERADLWFHNKLISGELPESIGGGVGQSRLAMFILQKAHIGEVQASVWHPDDVVACHRAGIRLI